ncbi:hypothetical protein [Mesorhizobium sp. ORS 3428]|uniref:hypothetical protein n=1 Tax=Mesorhizobium sp. ORS 3428 TaxID=540997 RepID=UPI00104200D0|nr:hypothetical protein [Mesorhizobium sp. ORS 3428]
MAGVGAHSVAFPVDFGRTARGAGPRIFESPRSLHETVTRQNCVSAYFWASFSDHRHEAWMTVVTPKFGMGATVHVDIPTTPERIWAAIRDAATK